MRLTLFLIGLCAWAQNATLTGKVSDPDGGAVRDADIRIKNTVTQTVTRAMSGRVGEYRASLPAGSFEISVVMPCCQYGAAAPVTLALKAGETKTHDVRLPWGANLGALGDDPILLLNDFRERASVPKGRAPRMPDGKPDLQGIWINVYNPDTPPPPLQPWAADLVRKRSEEGSKDYPGGYCLPPNASSITRAFPYKFVQTPKLLVVIHESDTPGLRQIFLDGRKHPADWNPTWQGHSIGHWEKETLVVETVGFNDRAWLSLSGIPHTEQLRVVERMRRADLGHLEVEIVMEDPGAFTAPWKRTFTATLAPPEEEILEFICNENNTDPQHYQGK